MRTQAVLLGSLTIPGQPVYLHTAREFIARALHPDDARLDTAVLLTSELVTNSVTHSESWRLGGTVTITLISVPDGIRVEVIDDGSENEPAVRLSQVESPELIESGRGLQLVEFLSANWGYYRDTAGTVTWFELTEQPDE
jgi:anti-sigma regulatory factor (Ser/Thr protein kinase)